MLRPSKPKISRSRKYYPRWLIGFVIIFSPWFLVLLMREIGPITYPPLESEFLWFIFNFLFFSFFCYFTGYLIAYMRNMKLTNTAVSVQKNLSSTFQLYFRLVSALSLLFVALSIVDFFIIKNASISQIIELREQENITGPRYSLIGAMVSLLSGSPSVLLALVLARRDVAGRQKIYQYGIILMGFAVMFLSGGRNPFFIGILFAFSFYSFFSPKKDLLQKNLSHNRLIALLAVGAIGIGVLYSMYLFIGRSIYVGINVVDMVQTLSMNYHISIFNLNSESEVISALYAIFVFLVFYVTHSLNYISDYFSQSYAPMLYGSYTIPHLARLLDTVVGTNFFEQSRAALLINGAYLSLPGSFYLDFGAFGAIILGGIISFVFGGHMLQLSQLKLIQKFIFTYFVVAFIFSPIYCVFGMSNGFSIIFLIILLLLVSIRIRN